MWRSIRLWRKRMPRVKATTTTIALTHDASTLTSFMRPDAPDLMETAAFRHRKCSATKATSSSLALPSTGGDFSFASQVPSGACIREEARALGFTLICMCTVAISAYGVTSRFAGGVLPHVPWHFMHDRPLQPVVNRGHSPFPHLRARGHARSTHRLPRDV